METELLLAELNKINGRLDDISNEIQSLKESLLICRKKELKNDHDKYATWPLDSELDKEDEKELQDARLNASIEWNTIKSLENIINSYKKTAFLRK